MRLGPGSAAQRKRALRRVLLAVCETFNSRLSQSVREQPHGSGTN
jgi:hypothetical protein